MEVNINNRFVIFSDTDNDTFCINSTLKYTELITKKELIEDLSGLSIIHTGDFVDKKAPDLKVPDFFREMQKTIGPRNGHIKILAGNHEQEILQKIKNGEDYGLSKKTLNSLCTYIESLDLFYVTGPMLFIHSYPTVEFLRALLHYREVTGKHVNNFNADHYKKAFKSVKALSQYSYVRNPDEIHLLYDPVNAADYYRSNSSELTSLLTELEIDCIIHGHRPQSSGKQVDQEFAKWIPGIRMIGNDTKVRQNGIGATVVRMDVGRDLQVAFINSSTATKKNRKKIRVLLRPSAPGSAILQQRERERNQCSKLEQQLELITRQSEAQQEKLNNELREHKTSSLLLQEELQERDDLYQKSQDKLESLKDNIQKLESGLKKNNKQQSLTADDNDELFCQPSVVSGQADKQNIITEKALAELNLSKVKLEQALEKSNHIRKQAVDYLRLSHNANLKVEQELEQCSSEKSEIEQALQATWKKQQALKQQLQLKRPHWIFGVYVALVSCIFSGVVIYYLLAK